MQETFFRIWRRRDEIAFQTGASEGLVKVRIRRAKEKLKTLLKDLMP